MSVVKTLKSVAEQIDICRSLQDARSSRIRIPQAPSVLGRMADFNVSTPRATVRGDVCEALARLGIPLTLSPPIGSDASLRSLIQQEIATAVSLVRQPRQPLHAVACGNSKKTSRVILLQWLQCLQ